eukprot:403373921
MDQNYKRLRNNDRDESFHRGEGEQPPWLLRAFFYLYPSKVLKANNQEAIQMRRLMLFCLVIHILFFILSLALLGFLSMIEDLFLGLICFSGYLTLFDWTIAFYLVALALTTLLNFINLFKYQELKLLVYLGSMGFNVIAFLVILRAYWVFERVGGNMHSSWGNPLDGSDSYMSLRDAEEPLLKVFRVTCDGEEEKLRNLQKEKNTDLESGSQSIAKKKKKKKKAKKASLGDGNLLSEVIGDAVMDKLDGVEQNLQNQQDQIATWHQIDLNHNSNSNPGQNLQENQSSGIQVHHGEPIGLQKNQQSLDKNEIIPNIINPKVL